MTAYLRLQNMDFHGNTSYANLQIGVNQGIDSKAVGWFEIKGDNGRADGGTWEWGRDEYNFISLILTSNKFRTIIGKLKLNEWGKGGIPPQPHFRQTSKGFFTYIFPGYGKEILCDCQVVKILG